MVDVDKLTDHELQTKLSEFGYPVMPITGTTRKVMVKKLKLLMENKGKPNDSGRRSLGRYSSEEESDNEVKPKKSNRRVTMGVTSMEPPVKAVPRRSIAKVSEPIVESEPPRGKNMKEVTVVTTTTTTKTLKNSQDEFDTGSDSESEIVDKYNVSFKDDYNKKSPIKTSHSPTYSSSLHFNKLNDKSPSTLYKRSSLYSPVETHDDKLSSIRSRLSVGSPVYEPSTSYTPAYSVSTAKPDKIETPFLSNFTKRLSQLSPGAAKSSDYDSIIKEQDTNGTNVYPRMYSRPVRSKDAYTFGGFGSSQSAFLKNNLVPFGVLALIFIFFLFLAVIYQIKSDSAVIEASGYVIPYCERVSPPKRGVNCITEADVTDTVTLLHIVRPYLNKLAVQRLCDSPSVRSHVTEDEIVDYVKNNYKIQGENAVRRDLNHLELLSFRNPLWQISVLQLDDENDPIREENIASSMEQVLSNNNTKTIALAVLNPSLPWSCNLYNKIASLLSALVFVGLVFGCLYLFTVGYKFYEARQKQEHSEVVAMVEKIIEVLQNNSTENGDNCLVINHVRDLIIPIADRKRKQAVWKKAVSFVNENESRVRMEVQEVQGEAFEVWRWLGAGNISLAGSSPNRSAVWQGQAFDTRGGSVNSPPCSPTSCLKVRGMLEEGTAAQAREAVLAKCGTQCRILHCDVDLHGKCVYVKCQDTVDAGLVYRSLHGWWYSGHLVTVKYLRLERYMQRFPESPSNGPYLKSTGPPADWVN